ncbi:MAG: hypothetical protein JWN18_206 [Parcubacteria group bacterium]|nr:hypothetical protein [Parcubacteria group bacterium]
MDEILIEEKKYVSSKRAAKITGYAKDYIGQLCREGRVPARLVGRSWYVLESAIQDHRFGKPVEGIANSPKEEVQTWVSPRYEAAPVEILPTIQDQEEVVVPSDFSSEPVEAAEEPIQPLQESWRAWFDQTGSTSSVQEKVQDEQQKVTVEEIGAPQTAPEQHITIGEPDEEIQIPVRTMYELPPEDLLPRYIPHEEQPTEPKPAITTTRVRRKSIMGAFQLVAVLVAVFMGTLAIISTGYFDRVVGSFNQASVFTGIKIFSR